MDKKNVRKLMPTIEFSADASLEAKRQIRVTAASGKADRVGDIVQVAGIRLENYKKNPIVLYGHDHFGLPIARAVEMGVVGGKLEMVFEFADAETYAFADTVYRLVKKGFLKGVSIGARVLEAEYLRDDDERVIGRQYNELELLEVSVVAIPADSKALITAVKSGAVSEAEFEEYLAKSLDAPLDTPTENHVEQDTVGSSPEDESVTKDQLALKDQLDAQEKRLAAIENLIKLHAAANETSTKSVEAINGVIASLTEQLAAKQAPDLAALGNTLGSMPGPGGDLAKQMLGMIDQMMKKVR